ncbi:MAG: peptide chain release factor 1 [Polaribacter sp.]|jgi:peptide chain release factor 1
MLDKLNAIHERYIYLEEQLGDPEIFSDQVRFTKVNKEYKGLEEIIAVRTEFLLLAGNIDTAKEMLADPEMKEMAQMELDELKPQVEVMEEKIKMLLVPKDPEDERDVVFEIRAGAGGDEACLFAGDLYKMYSRYFDDQGWKTEAITINEGTVGGYSKLVLEVTGTEVFGKLKFESGAHRVQRVPKTESKGRLHTSAVTVVVMPKLVLEDVNINKADLKTDTFRASGAGGQHVNKTESGVRFTHLPTGIVSESTDGRSQIKNRDIALQRLYTKIYDAQKEAHDSKVSSARKSLVGSGDRSDKIRTYNFPQNRVTDHRIGLSLNKLDKVLAGAVGEIVDALCLHENTEKLKAGEED